MARTRQRTDVDRLTDTLEWAREAYHELYEIDLRRVSPGARGPIKDARTQAAALIESAHAGILEYAESQRSAAKSA